MRQRVVKAIDFIKALSPQKRMGLIASILVLLALPLTVIVAQQQQNLKQEAAKTYPTRTGCVRNPAYNGDLCGPGPDAYRLITSLNASSECYNYSQCLSVQGSSGTDGTCVKSPAYSGDTCKGYRFMPGISRTCYTLQQCRVALRSGVFPTPSPIASASPTLTPTPTPVSACTKDKCSGASGWNECKNRSTIYHPCPTGTTCRNDELGSFEACYPNSSPTLTPTPRPPTPSTPPPPPPATTYNPGTYYCTYGGATGYSYRNSATGVCTNGTYTGFYHSPTCTTTSANLGKAVLIQPCSYTYYSSSNCSGSTVGYHQCTSRTVTSN